MDYKKTWLIPNSNLKQITVFTFIIWTTLIIGSLRWSIKKEHHQTVELAKKTARATFNKDVAFRLWATRHGGVYVPPTEHTPPNPYLSHIPDRDIVTSTGKQLTLMNPAYMVRQMMEEYDDLYGIKGRITSLKTLNLNNEPDEWERKALLAFDKGIKEISEFAEIDGEPYLRLIQPLITAEGCLKCHGYQGYNVGDVRGGVGVSVPMETFLTSEKQITNAMIYTHSGIWILGVIVIGFITYRSSKRNEAQRFTVNALQKSEENWRSLTENSPDHIVTLDLDLIIQFANYASPGLSVKDLIGKPIHKMVEEDDQQRVKSVLEKVILTGKSTSYETEYNQPGGEIIYYESRVNAIQHNGRVVGLTLNARDITERKQTENDLIKSNRSLKMLSECNQSLVYSQDELQLLKDMCKNIISYGEYKLAWIGFAEHDEKKSVRLIAEAGYEEGYMDSVKISWADNKYGRGPTGIAIRNGKPSIMRDILNDPNFKQWHEAAIKCGYASTIALPLVENKNVFGALNIYSTETDTFDKNEVALLLELANDIAFGIHTIRIRKERLLALEEARQANKVKDLFLANMSHEIRTPLNSMLGFTQIIEERFKDQMDEQESEYFQIINSSGHRLINTVHGVLDISRIEAGVMPHNPEIIQLATPIESIYKEFKLAAVEKNLKFTYNNQIDDGTVKVDEPSLVKAFSNLVDNAIKYTEEGQIKIQLNEQNGKYVLSISDTGIGIGTDYLNRIYDAFSQESTGYTKKYQGLGLGLSIAKSCLDMNGIPIAVESKQGVGTTFSLTFTPADRVIAEPEIKTVPTGTKVEKTVSKVKPVVLLVEDDLHNRRALEVILKQKYETPYAVSVDEAKKQLRENVVDLIILDLSLEGDEDGLDLVKYMKAKKGLKDIPVIAVTAHAFPTDRDNVLNAGCDDYMSKPINIKKLLDMIGRYLN